MKRRPGQPLVLETSLVQDNQPSRITPNLYVGSVHAAFNADGLKQIGVTHIINVSGYPSTFPNKFVYLTMDLRDKTEASLLSCLPIALLFMQIALKSSDKHVVLVHCAGGRSRSPALVIAYLMYVNKVPFGEALQHVKAMRHVVELNRGFEVQLRAFERTQYDIFAAHQLVLHYAIVKAALHRELRLTESPTTPGKNRRNVASKPFLQPNKASTQKHKQAIPYLVSRVLLSRPNEGGIVSLPLLRSMEASYGCKQCGNMVFTAQNILLHSSWTDSRNWKVELSSPDRFVKHKGRPKDYFADSPPQTPSAAERDHKEAVQCTDPVSEDACIKDPKLTLTLTSTTAESVGLPTPVRRGTVTRAKRSDGSSVYSFPSTPRHVVPSSVNTSSPEISTAKRSSVVTISERKVVEGPRRFSSAPVSSFPENGSQEDYRKVFTYASSSDRKKWIQQMDSMIGVNEASPRLRNLVRTLAAQDDAHLNQLAATQCRDCFIEVLPWMGEMTSEEGTLYCPQGANRSGDGRCNAILGSWEWSGTHCSCGAWISPAVRIDVNAIQRVDVKNDTKSSLNSCNQEVDPLECFERKVKSPRR